MVQGLSLFVKTNVRGLLRCGLFSRLNGFLRRWPTPYIREELFIKFKMWYIAKSWYGTGLVGSKLPARLCDLSMPVPYAI